MTKQADLTAYLFDGQASAGGLAGDLLVWMDGSARFTAFVETYRDKIRKKIRVTRDLESQLDLRAELAVARGLLADRRFTAAYEPYASEKRRGPDFAVTYRANLVFNVEVARMRGGEGAPPAAERVQRILLNKLGQMQAGQHNLLVIHALALAPALDLGQAVQALKTRVEARDPAFAANPASARYASPAAFYKDFLHLSGILLWQPAAQLWLNRQARPQPPEPALRLAARLAAAQENEG